MAVKTPRDGKKVSAQADKQAHSSRGYPIDQLHGTVPMIFKNLTSGRNIRLAVAAECVVIMMADDA